MRRRPTKRFYLFLSVVCAIVVLASVLLLRGVPTITLEEGTMAFEQQYEVVLVRDEQVYNATNYGKAVFYATEGQRVSSGNKIAEVYRWGYSESMFTELAAVRQKILDYQENTVWRNVVNADLNAINSKIAAKIEEVRAAVSGEQRVDIVSLQSGLAELLEQKRTFLRQNVQADSTLNGLYAQEDALLTQMANWREDVVATGSGIVSFHLDGLEDRLSPDTLDTMTMADYNAALSGVTTADSGTDTKTRPLYRLVDNYAWYCVIHAPANEPIAALAQGESFLITFEGYQDTPYQGTVIGSRKPEDGGGDTLYFIEIKEDIGQLVSVRTAVSTLRKEYTGIKVPQSALYTENDVRGVKILQDGKTVFTPVKIVMEDADDAVIQTAENGMELQAGMQVITR